MRLGWLQATADSRSTPRRDLYILAGIVVVAAALRFSTLGVRSFWVDEGVVYNLVHLSLGNMLSDLWNGAEGTPPLYYTLAWFWTHAFGSGEFELRSLSAILGTAAVPVAFVAGKEVISTRVGLVAASLFALSPFLVWHSQDARAHALAGLFAGLSFVFFVRALREPRRSTVAWWAVLSAIGVFSHYFVAFLAIAEGAWLILAFPSRRVLLAGGGIALSMVVMLPMAAAQKTQSIDTGYANYGSLPKRLIEIPAQLLVGEQPPLQVTAAVLAALLVLPALWVLLRRASDLERRAALIPAIVGAVGVAVPVVGGALGSNYLIARNLMPFWLPIVLLLAIGFSSLRVPRIVPAAGLALCVLWLTINVVTAGVPKFEREDWRGAADVLGSAQVSRAVVVTPQPGRGPLTIYLKRGPAANRVREITRDPGARVREIDVVGLAGLYRKVGRRPLPPRPDRLPAAPPGFHLVQRKEAKYFTILRYRASAPVTVRRTDLGAMRLSSTAPAILLQRGP